MINTDCVLQKAIMNGFDPKKISEYHYSNKNMSLEEYSMNCRQKIYEINRYVKKVYLDMKYWIYLREVYKKETTDPKKIDLYNKMNQLSTDNKIICPISWKWIK